ncbi:MAG: heme-binding protein [Planctomycetales bacterium]|nr:heme-binding protein [Planctomycetales bacterium]
MKRMLARLPACPPNLRIEPLETRALLSAGTIDVDLGLCHPATESAVPSVSIVEATQASMEDTTSTASSGGQLARDAFFASLSDPSIASNYREPIPALSAAEADSAVVTRRSFVAPPAAIAESFPQPPQGILSSGKTPQAPAANPPVVYAPLAHVGLDETITADDVSLLLRRAAAASASEDAIIAIVDRGGRILGVRVERLVPINVLDTETLVFAIDGAVAKARTAAFFANDDAPLTSRLIRFISQSTITQREVESNPNASDPTERGPGFVAPIGLGGHFPPQIAHTPLVDLFAIEHTNRDSIISPGPDGVKGTGDDVTLAGRFNEVMLSGVLEAPESYGYTSGLMEQAQSRGIATLPGGIPLFKNGHLVGGIGVFFPGSQGYATYEQGFQSNLDPVTKRPLPVNQRQTEKDRTNADRVLEAELIAYAAAGGSTGFNFEVKQIGTVPDIPAYDLPAGRLTLVGIELEVVGPHPRGVNTLRQLGNRLLQQSPVNSGTSILAGFQAQYTSGDISVVGPDVVRKGEPAADGWLVPPRNADDLSITKNDVELIINRAIAEANQTRAAIRLPISQPASMVFSVTDKNGKILGLFRMPDATVFSVDVAVAKARNPAYYADATAIVDLDRVDADVHPDGVPDIAAGTAFTNRTFRFLADPRFPDGVERTPPGPFSVLNDPGTDPVTGETTFATTPADHVSVLGHDAFFPMTNFRDADNVENQNGIVFFPGSTPLYVNGQLVGGLGVSGDGVDQDDVVTFAAAQGYLPPNGVTRADEVFVRNVRLPYQKFLRNPRGGL